MSASISDKTNFHHKNSVNRLRQIPTGACVTPTKQSKPIYSNIRYLCSENGNNTYVTDTNEMAVNTGSISSYKYSLDSSVDDFTELDRLIEFHANASQRDSFHFDSNVIPLDSSILSETFSNISWLDAKCSSEKLASEEVVKDCSKRGAESHRVKHISGIPVANDQMRVNIHETPKRTNLKPFERDKKQKPLRLANLPRKIYTRGKNEVRITKEDIKIVETNSINEMFDIKKHLARARRKLTFPQEDSFKTTSSSFTSIKPQRDSYKHSSISITSCKPRDDFDEKSSRSFTSSMPQGDSDKVPSISVTSTKPRDDFDEKSSRSFTSSIPQGDSDKIFVTSNKPREDFDEKYSRFFTSSMPQENSDKMSSISDTSTKIQVDSDNKTTGFIASREKQKDFNTKSLLHEVNDMEKRTVSKDNGYSSQKEKNLEARRKLTFPLEDYFQTSSSSFTSIKPRVDSHKNSSISITSSNPREVFVEKSSRSFTSNMPQDDSDKKSSNSVTSTQIQDSHKNTTGFIASKKKQEDFNIKSLLHEVSDMEKRTVPKDNGYFSQKEKSLKELGGKFLLEDYLAKLKGIATKPPTTKRAKEFEKRATLKTYFDFDEYCVQIFNLKEKFIDRQNKNKTV